MTALIKFNKAMRARMKLKARPTVKYVHFHIVGSEENYRYTAFFTNFLAEIQAVSIREINI